ncbi:MAG TPA: hypothetical protein VF521_18025 [Pyrinomonadaceae bacterium]
MKSNSTATAVGVLLLGLGIALGLAYYFGALDLLRGGPNENAARQGERRANPNASPPAQDAAGPGAQLAAEREDLRKKIEQLHEAVVKDAPALRTTAVAAAATQAQKDAYKNFVLERLPELTGQVRKSFDDLDAQVAALKVVQAEQSEAPALSPEQQTLVNAVSRENRSWALPALALLSLLLLVALTQFFLLRRQQRRLVAEAKDELLHNVQNPIKEINDTLRGDVTEVKQSLGRFDSQVLADNVKNTLATAKSVGNDVKEVLSKLAVYGDRPGEQSWKGENVDAFFEQQKKAAAVGGFVYENEGTMEQAEPHRFPAPVGEYMRLVKGSAHPVRADYINDVLVEDLSSNGALVLVKNPPAVRDGTSYVVPSIDYFLSEQDYVKNYSNYFDCSEQQAGYVWIDKPASVRKVADGWKLVDKGILEVRQ